MYAKRPQSPDAVRGSSILPNRVFWFASRITSAKTDKERLKTLSVRFALPVDTTANAFPDQARSNGPRKAGFVAARRWIWPSVI